MTERENIEAAREDFRALEKHLRNIRKINEEAGRNQVSNAVFGLEGEVMALHSKATATLHQFWPDIADEVQAKGPGGR
jgi:hypothetical protein